MNMNNSDIFSVFLNNDLFSYIRSFLIIIGQYGSFILFLTTLFLFVQLKLLTTMQIYLLGSAINLFLNIIIKIILKHPRPTEDLELFHLTKQFAPWTRFGTPSTNIQTMLFTITFTAFTTLQIYILLPYFIIIINTMLQELIFTPSYYVYQVIIAAVIGSIVGYLFYLLSNRLLKGNLKEKEEENAPIIRGLL